MTTNSPVDNDQEIESINQRLQALEEERNRLLSRRARLESKPSTLAPQAKVALFQEFFAGRDDVYAFRWENE